MIKIQKGDNVKIVAGKDKGKKGKVLQIFPSEQRLVVEGCNKMVKHLKAKKQREKGQRIEFDAPLNVSNVQLICSKCNKLTRIGFKKLENNKKVRTCSKCKETI
ncbi:MAG: 50S ribosomal protein L24 [Patescibacteria group bacterium]